MKVDEDGKSGNIYFGPRRGPSRVPKALGPSRGVRGHAPPEKFWNLEALWCILVISERKNTTNFTVKKSYLYTRITIYFLKQ